MVFFIVSDFNINIKFSNTLRLYTLDFLLVDTSIYVCTYFRYFINILIFLLCFGIGYLFCLFCFKAVLVIISLEHMSFVNLNVIRIK